MTERRLRRRPGENREYLLEAGLVEFGLSGYHGTATARIATRAGVPQPHVYASFRTKQELFLACVEASADRVRGSEANADDELLILQAVAAAQTPDLSGPLREILSALRHSVGDVAFHALLARAARSMLAPSAPEAAL